MALAVVSASTVEPVSVAEFKAHARIDGNEEDDVIAAYLASARQHCEAYLNRNLTGGANTLRLSMDSFYDERYTHCGTIYLPNPPLVSSTSVSVTYASSAGSTGTAVGSSVYTVDTDSEPARLAPAYGETWPSPIRQLNAVTVTYSAGYSTASAVPQGVRTAIKMLASNWFENREAAVEGVAAELPLGIKALLDPHKWGM